MTLKNKIKYFLNNFDYLRVYNSPFKPPKIKFYFGKIALGTPYFYPRKWVKGTPELAIKSAVKKMRETRQWNKLNPNYARRETPFRELYERSLSSLHPVPKKIGFDFVSLGWKTKWRHDDYRHEWNPMISFVFFKWQIAVMMIPKHDMHYWESWLYYTRETKGNTAERIAQCRKKAPQTWTRHSGDEKETTDYYDLILKKKWL